VIQPTGTLLTYLENLWYENLDNQQCGDEDDSILAYWSFNDELNLGHDDSGNGHNGSVIGTRYIANGAVVVRSNLHQQMMGYYSKFIRLNTNIMSIAFWFKRTTSDRGVIIARDVRGLIHLLNGRYPIRLKAFSLEAFRILPMLYQMLVPLGQLFRSQGLRMVVGITFVSQSILLIPILELYI